MGFLLIQKNGDTMILWLKSGEKKIKANFGSHVGTTGFLSILEEAFEKTEF